MWRRKHTEQHGKVGVYKKLKIEGNTTNTNHIFKNKNVTNEILILELKQKQKNN